MSDPKLQPIFAWPGGKRLLAKHILPLPEHDLYVDVFCGAGGFFLNKPRSRHEIINDINGDLINFFRCVKHHKDELLREIEFATNSRRDFVDFGAQPGLTDIQRAGRWFMRMKCGFGGGGRSFAVQRKNGGSLNSSLNKKRAQIALLSDRLDTVVIENLDWRRCIELYDDPRTLFFLDPPYTNCDSGNYKSWKPEQMRELRDVIAAIKGTFVLTVNDSPENRELFASWNIQSISRPRGIANKNPESRRTYTELVIKPKQL